MGGKDNQPPTTNSNTLYPYTEGNTFRRQLSTQPSQPWCSRPNDIVKKQYVTYSFPTTLILRSDGTSYWAVKILSSNTHFLGIW
jgi:hypothetical protein